MIEKMKINFEKNEDTIIKFCVSKIITQNINLYKIKDIEERIINYREADASFATFLCC